jgi:nucleotide-binding universal stress UspA family protein
VIEPVAPWIDEVPLETRKMLTTTRASSLEKLEKLAQFAEAANVRAQVVVRNGFVDTVIQSVLRANAVDLVVMGTHGRRELGKFFLGSTTERLLRKLKIPLLTIRSAAPVRRQPIKRILVTTDLSEATSEAIAFAWFVAKTYGAKITLLHVLNDLQADLSGDYRQQLTRGIESDLENLVPDAARDLCTVRVVTGQPIRRILPIVKNDKIDLIVMNIHGKTVMDRITIGSTAEKIIRAADVPVLTVPFDATRKRKPGALKKAA